MGKNNEFVGVDDRYLSGNENNNTSDDNDPMAGVREDVYTRLNDLSGYMSDENNKKKINKTVRKTAKMAKGIGAVYLTLLILIPIIAIGMMIFAVVSLSMNKKSMDEKRKEMTATSQEIVIEPTIADISVPDIGDAAVEASSLQTDGDKMMFNSSYEFYEGTQSGNSVSFMLDNLVKDGNSGEHIIEVSYGDVSSTDVNDISTISDGFDAFTEYNVELGYNKDGYVNRIIVTDK